jgi:hypothetical protein
MGVPPADTLRNRLSAYRPTARGRTPALRATRPRAVLVAQREKGVKVDMLEEIKVPRRSGPSHRTPIAFRPAPPPPPLRAAPLLPCGCNCARTLAHATKTGAGKGIRALCLAARRALAHP